MNFLTKCIGFMAVLCAVDASWAAQRAGADVGRVSVRMPGATTALRRLPTISTINSAASTGSASGTKSTMTANECVDAYTECIRGSDACGADFEECTTNTLFYSKKPVCNNTLLQCSSAAVNTLFGNSNITALANKDSNDEYIYPTAGSILGQFIEASQISNRLDTGNCVKKYTSCLKKESVCGGDFELCTNDTEFKRQRVFCESTLARCQADGVRALFGTDVRTAKPAPESNIGLAITEGARLAANNAVATCRKVTEQCFLGACEQNPYKCTVGADVTTMKNASKVVEQETGSVVANMSNVMADTIQRSDVAKYLRGECRDTIGSNKYCFMSYQQKIPTSADLLDEDTRDEIFDEAYNRQFTELLQTKVEKILNNFDKKSKDKCYATLESCVKRSCGEGMGAVCYARVRANGNINDGTTYNEIDSGCRALVNNDANCQYAATQDGTYRYSDAEAFDTVFPKYASDQKDSLGFVGMLKSNLDASYSPAVIEKYAKQCKNVATSCIKSMCGKDYTNCYRNRTDIMANVYSDSVAFADSMNKVGGVLDFTIVTGLCMDTVKNAKACEEHFGIMAAKNDNGFGSEVEGWNAESSVRGNWNDAVSGGYSATAVDVKGEFVETGQCSIDPATASSKVCKIKANNTAMMQECNTTDADGCLYTLEQVVTRKDYKISMTANTLFREVLADAEKDAQAIYNMKITQEQNACRAENKGGIMGRNDMTGSTYRWVKLKSRKVPNNYPTQGLKEGDFVPNSNDLYGSFCVGRVTIQSDDPEIQKVLQNGVDWSTRYFAVGDAFTCGSWIPQDELETISETVAEKTGASKDGKLSKKQLWGTIGASLLTAGAGVGISEALQQNTGMGKASGLTRKVSKDADREKLVANLGYWEGEGSEGLCKASDNSEDGCYLVVTKGQVAGFTIREKAKSKCTPNGEKTCSSSFKYDDYMKSLREKLEVDANGDDSLKEKKGARAGLDLAMGAGMSAITATTMTAALKEKNRQQYTAAQQEWLDQVGSHITCYVGTMDQSVTFGEPMELVLE